MGGKMDLHAYQKRASSTDRNPESSEKGMMIPLLGLAGEAGELLTEYKKISSRRRLPYPLRGKILRGAGRLALVPVERRNEVRAGP